MSKFRFRYSLVVKGKGTAYMLETNDVLEEEDFSITIERIDNEV